MTDPRFSRLAARELYRDAPRRWLEHPVREALLCCAIGVVLGVWCVIERMP